MFGAFFGWGGLHLSLISVFCYFFGLPGHVPISVSSLCFSQSVMCPCLIINSPKPTRLSLSLSVCYFLLYFDSLLSCMLCSVLCVCHLLQYALFPGHRPLGFTLGYDITTAPVGLSLVSQSCIWVLRCLAHSWTFHNGYS